MISHSETTKTLRARELGISRSTLYYKSQRTEKDWQLKCRIEEPAQSPFSAIVLEVITS